MDYVYLSPLGHFFITACQTIFETYHSMFSFMIRLYIATNMYEMHVAELQWNDLLQIRSLGKMDCSYWLFT